MPPLTARLGIADVRHRGCKLPLARVPFAAAALCAFAFAAPATAQTSGTWNTNAGGSWSSTNNWLGGLVANGAGATANLTFDITAATTVSIDTSVTLGALNIGDASTNYTLALSTGSLTFDNNGSGATITKTGVAQTNSAGFSLNDSLTINNATGTGLTLSGSISNGVAGAKTITKTGTGAVILSGANTAFTGDVIISGGILQTGSSSSLGAANAVRLDSGATLRVNSSVSIAGLTDNAGLGGSVANSSGGGKILTVAGSGAYSFGGSFTGSASTTKVGLAISGSGTQILAGNNTTNIGYQSVTGGGALVYAKQNAIFQGLSAGAVTNGNATANAGIYVGSGSTVALGVGDAASGYFDSAAIATFLDATHMGLSTTSSGFASSSIFGFDTANATGGTFTYSTALTNIGTSTGIGFAKLGTGTLILDAANTYGGVTQVRAGTLQLGSSGTTGSISSSADITVSSGAALSFNRSDTALALGNKITGSGAVMQNGPGTTTLSSTTSDYSGGTTITAGKLILKSLGSGSVTIGGGATQLNLNSGSTFSNTISISGGTGIGSQGLIDTGTGLNVVLSGPISISGAPTNGGHFGSSSTGSLTLSGPITSSVPVVFRRGTGIISGGGSGYTALQVRADTLKVGAANGIASTATVALGGDGAATLDLNGYNQSLVGITKGANSATLLNNGAAAATLTTTGTSTYAGTIQDGTSKIALTVSGGSLTLSGTNSYTGATTISAGILSVTNGSAISDAASVTLSDVSGAAFVVNSSETIGSLRGGGSVGGNVSVASGKVLTVSESGSQVFAGQISNAGGLTKSGNGTLTLSGANTYSGSTTVSSGLLELSSSSGAAAGSTGSVSVASGATLLISRSNQVNDSGAVSLSGGTILLGSGVSETFAALTLNGASTLDFGAGNSGTMWFNGSYTGNSYKLTLSNLSSGEVWKINQDLTASIPINTYGAGTQDFGSGFSITSSGGFTSGWDGTSFTITAIPEPSTYVAAIGLIALFVWPLRHLCLSKAAVSARR